MDPVQRLRDEPISSLAPFPLLAVAPTQTVADAVRLMQRERFGCVLVCEGKRPIGVITERDVLRRLGTSAPMDAPAAAATRGVLWSVKKSDSLETAIRQMHRHQCRHLTVLDDAGEAVGILSVQAVVHALVEHFPASVYNLPPLANQVSHDREGA